MALVDYATLAEMKTVLNLVGQTYADAEVTLAISAASRAVDHRTGRQFWPDDTATPRVFTAGVADWLVTGDFQETASLVVAWDGVTRVRDTDYFLEPGPPAPAGPPWAVIRRLGLALPLGARAVTVTAKWGWPAIPDEIRQATRILAARFFRRPREAAFGVAGLGVDSSAVYVSKYDPDVDVLLAPYRMRGFDY